MSSSSGLKEILFYATGAVLGIAWAMKTSFLYAEDETGDNKKKRKSNSEEPIYFTDEDLQSISEEMKNVLQCPIKQSIYKYPVISPYGFTSEQEIIERWLENKNTCPFTKKALFKKDLIFNRNLFNIIKFLVLKHKYNQDHADKIQDSEIIKD